MHNPYSKTKSIASSAKTSHVFKKKSMPVKPIAVKPIAVKPIAVKPIAVKLKEKPSSTAQYMAHKKFLSTMNNIVYNRKVRGLDAEKLTKRKHKKQLAILEKKKPLDIDDKKTIERFALAHSILEYVQKTLRLEGAILPTNRICEEDYKPVNYKKFKERFEFVAEIIYNSWDDRKGIEASAIAGAWPARWGVGNCDQNAYLSIIEACKAFTEDCTIEAVIENDMHIICKITFPNELEGKALIIDSWADDPIMFSEDRVPIDNIKEAEDSKFTTREEKDRLLEYYDAFEDECDDNFSEYQEQAYRKFNEIKKLPDEFNLDHLSRGGKSFLSSKLDKEFKKAQNISHEILVKEHQGNKSDINQALDIKRELMHEIRSNYIQSQMEQFLQDKKDRLEYVPEVYPNRQFSLPDGLDPRKA